jgi:1-deoxy-D-xylulose-5-phosphate reductoisomerase
VRVRDVILLGSTGSIGTQAIEVVSGAPDRFRITGLAATGRDVAALATQVRQTGARVVAVADVGAVPRLRAALDDPAVEILAGDRAATELAARSADVVLNGITGAVGLEPTLAALAAGTMVALANKESLVIGGPLVTAAAAPGQLVPVDSEHSALAQCLRGGRADEVSRLILTASGGPFRGRGRADLASVTPEQALAHPTWSMGPVITVNSATLVNKGLELIEAHLLFGVDLDLIDVVVHPPSIVHSMVQFTDGSILAQASPPDMRLPIALGIGWPDRVPGAIAAVDFGSPQTWEFYPLDEVAFPAVGLARTAARTGGTAPAVLNAANEAAVAAFLAGRLGFLGIVDTVAEVLSEHEAILQPTLGDVLAADAWARSQAARRIGTPR